MTVYLAHLDTPLNPHSPAQHYLGYTDDLWRRLAEHRESHWRPYAAPVYQAGQRHLGETVGRGATFLAVANQRGIPWHIVRVWPDGDRELERQLKAQHHAARLCPWCHPERVPFPGIAVVDWLAQEYERLLRSGDDALAAALAGQMSTVAQDYPAAQQGMFWVAV